MRFWRTMLLAGIGAATLAASPVMWNLNNVQLGDGTTVTGSFIADADTNIFSDLIMTTSGGNSVPSTSNWFFNTQPPLGGWINTLFDAGIFVVDSNSADLSSAEWMDLIATPPQDFTDAGGTIPMANIEAGACLTPTCGGTATVRGLSGQFVSSATAAPEPATLLLGASALCVIWALKRRSL